MNIVSPSFSNTFSALFKLYFKFRVLAQCPKYVLKLMDVLNFS